MAETQGPGYHLFSKSSVFLEVARDQKTFLKHIIPAKNTKKLQSTLNLLWSVFYRFQVWLNSMIPACADGL